MRLVRSRASFDPDRRLRPYLYRIATNLAHDARRRRASVPLEDAPADGIGPDGAASERERAESERARRDRVAAAPRAFRRRVASLRGADLPRDRARPGLQDPDGEVAHGARHPEAAAVARGLPPGGARDERVPRRKTDRVSPRRSGRVRRAADPRPDRERSGVRGSVRESTGVPGGIDGGGTRRALAARGARGADRAPRDARRVAGGACSCAWRSRRRRCCSSRSASPGIRRARRARLSCGAAIPRCAAAASWSRPCSCATRRRASRCGAWRSSRASTARRARSSSAAA